MSEWGGGIMEGMESKWRWRWKESESEWKWCESEIMNVWSGNGGWCEGDVKMNESEVKMNES